MTPVSTLYHVATSGYPSLRQTLLRIPLPSIRRDFSGFTALVNFYKSAENLAFDVIEVDMSGCYWLDADMCAAFGAILYNLSARINDIRLLELRPAVAGILGRNGFLRHYGGEAIPDHWGSTVPYQRMNAEDEAVFAVYIERKFIERSEMPEMSRPLKKKFREGVSEIFSNAAIHSQSRLGIFSCGQFFRSKRVLAFSVADLGVGIKENVRIHKGFDLAADEAIAWATIGNNTTKRGPIPGGLGLKLIQEFVKINQGSLRIVSDAGYWLFSASEVVKWLLPSAFPRTIVTIVINTSDSNSYALASEISNADIF